MAKIRLGIVGCGGIAAGKHADMLTKHFSPRAEITAFCDIIPERAEHFRGRFGTADAKVYTDYHDLVNDSSVDVVHVCTPNMSHAEITCAAFAAGKHVYCEKPMSCSTADGQQMIEAWKKSGKLFTIGLQNRHRLDVLALHRLMEEDEFGKIYYAKARGVTRRRVPDHGSYLVRDEQGGGALIDSGPHCIDIALYLMNNYKPASCLAVTFDYLGKGSDPQNQGNYLRPWDNKKFTVEDSAIALVKMQDGSVLYVESAWAMNINQWDYAQATICGTKAGASIDDGVAGDKPFKAVVNKIMGGQRADITLDTKWPWGTVPMGMGDFQAANYMNMGSWLDALEGKGDVLVKPEEALVVTQIIEGIYRSAESGKEYFFDSIS